MRKSAVFLVLLLIVAVTGHAENIIVNYVDGILELNEDGEWYELFIGEELPADSIVRLDNDSYAELQLRNDKIKLSRAGTYELKKLLRSRAEVNSSGMENLISGKFRTLIQDDSSKTQSTVGGVRAAEAETVGVDWMSSETAELIVDGKAALTEGNIDEALTYFTDAYDYSADAYEEAEALYFTGLAYAMSGDYHSALKNLDEVYIENDSEYYTDFYLLKAQLLIEGFVYDEAWDFLSGYDDKAARENPEKLQQVLFLYAVASNNTGHVSEARNILRRLINIKPDSETAEAAKNYQNNF